MIIKLNRILPIFIITLLFSIINNAAYSRLYCERSPELSSDVSSGYSATNFHLENTSSKSIEVKIQIEHIEHSGVRQRRRDTILTTEKILKLGPNESRNETVYCISNYSGTSKSFLARFFEDGNQLKEEHLAKKIDIGRTGYRSHISVLVDKLISEKSCKKLFYNDMYAAHYVPEDMKEMPTDWIAYTQYKCIMYTAKTFNSFSDEVKKALLDYVKAGGSLFIFGSMEEFSDIHFFSITNNNDTWIKRSYQLGFGDIYICHDDFFTRLVPPKKKETDSYSYSKKKKEEEEKENNEPEPANPIYSESVLYDYFLNYDGVYKFFQGENKIPDSIRQFKNEYQEQSKGPLFILVIVFLFLICPVNLIVLKILKKQQFILLTASMTGIVCGIILFGYYSLTTAKVFEIYRQSVTILNEKEQSAFTFGGQAFLSGKTVNESVELPLNSVVIPYLERDVYHGEKHYNFKPDLETERVIEFSDAQRLTKNWIIPNKPMAFSVTSQKQTDACLEIKEADGKVEIKNNLGTAIDSVYIVPQNVKRLYCLKDLKPGDTRIIDTSGTEFSHIDPFSGSKNIASFDYLKRNPKSVLKEGEYLAFLKSDPFLAQKFDSEANIHELGCAVLGIYKGNFNL